MTASPSRLRIAVLFGGRSAEHEVSVLSAANVVAALDPERYDTVPIFITRDGRWHLSALQDGALAQPQDGADLVFIAGGGGRLMAIADGKAEELPKIDIVFPVLHGLPGEDGSVQGLIDAVGVPLAGCGILGSATALDKDMAKRLFVVAGLDVAKAVTIVHSSAPVFHEIRDELGLPFFIKPARQGSSVGVSKVTDAAGYEAALAEAFRHDSKVLAEEFIAGREIECSVLEGASGEIVVSRPGEIVPAASHGFYSYDAKYLDENGAVLRVPAQLPAEVEAQLRAMALTAFRALGCDGMARADFFVTADMRCLVNELNTTPGFTNISMYAKALAASGIAYGEVIDRLVQHGLARARRP